jgi:hypothetical protein
VAEVGVTMSREWRTVVRGYALRLAELEDPRAAAALAAVPARRRWDLDALDAALRAPDPEADAVRALAAVPRPDGDEARALLDALRAAVLEVEDTRHAADSDDRAEEIVRAALAWHAEHGDRACPLCGTGQLGKGWRGWAELWLSERRGSAARAEIARARLARAEEDAKRLIGLVAIPRGLPIDTSALRAAVDHLASASSLRGRDLLVALDERLDAVGAALAAAQSAAGARLAAREERWRPIARGLAAVLAEARSAGADRGPAPSSAPRPLRRVRRGPRGADLETSAR